jgi:hypothetical protein
MFYVAISWHPSHTILIPVCSLLLCGRQTFYVLVLNALAMKKIMFLSFLLICLLCSCKKNRDPLIKPDIALDTSDRRTLRVQFYDEVTSQPLPGLSVQFVDQWAESAPPTPFWLKTDAQGVVQQRGSFTSNLLVSTGIDSIGSPYYMNKARLQWRPQDELARARYVIPEGLLTFQPVIPGAVNPEFKVYVPRRADLDLAFIQDSVYNSAFENGEINFYCFISSYDSNGMVADKVWEQWYNVTGGQPGAQMRASIRTYAGRTLSVRWYLVDMVGAVGYDDDAVMRTIRKGVFQLPSLPAGQTTSLSIHF